MKAIVSTLLVLFATGCSTSPPTPPGTATTPDKRQGPPVTASQAAQNPSPVAGPSLLVGVRMTGTWTTSSSFGSSSGELSLRLDRIAGDRVEAATLYIDVPRRYAAAYHNQDLAVTGTVSQSAGIFHLVLNYGGFLTLDVTGSPAHMTGEMRGGQAPSRVELKRPL